MTDHNIPHEDTPELITSPQDQGINFDFASVHERSEVIMTVTTALGGAVTTAQVAEVIIDAALPIFQARIGLVALLSDDGSSLECERIVGVSPAEADLWRSFPIDTRVPLADAVRERRLVVLPSPETHDAAYPEMAQERAAVGDGTLVAVPLLVGERCIGGVGLICPPERCRSTEQEMFLWTLAGQCAFALERARLYDAERRAGIQALAEINERRAVETALRESETRFRALADNIAQLAWMADGSGWIFWYNQRWFDYTGTTLEQMQGWGWKIVHDPGYVDAVVEKFAEHVRTGRAWEDTFPLRGKDGIYRWFLSRAFPIRNEAGDITLWCGTNTDVTEQREALARSTSASRREAMLNQIGQAVLRSSDAEEIQTLAVTALGRALGADRCYFHFFDLSQDATWIETDWHREGLPSVAGRYPLSQVQPTLLDDIFRHSASVRINDVGVSFLQPETVALLEQAHYRALLTTPFYAQGELTAVLVLVMADTPHVWTDEEVSLMEAVAVQTRAAVEAARVRRREQTIAEQLAQALQPETPARVPGLELAEYYRPALEDQGVGGDFTSVFSGDKGVTFLIVGDLSGKGLAAASQVATVRHMLRFALHNGQTVAGAVTALNRTLADHDLLTGFATLFVGRYDAYTRQLCFVNCGQDAGLILRAATGEIETMPPTGPVLGAVSTAVYTEESVLLEDDDVIALYTDGLTEAGPTRMALLTGEGVANLLGGLVGMTNPRTMVQCVMAGVDAHAGRGVRDDQCLLVGIVNSR